MESHLKCIHKIAQGLISIKELYNKNVVTLKTEFDKWKLGRKKAKSLHRERVLKTLGEKPRIRGYTSKTPFTALFRIYV